MKSPRFAFVLSVATLTLCGCKSDQQKTDTMPPKTSSATMQPVKSAAKPVNATCPVSGEAVPANATTVSYQGKTVGFCCDHCVAKWNNMSDAEKAAKIAAK